MRILLVVSLVVPSAFAVPVRAAEVQDTKYGYAISPPEFRSPQAGASVVRLTWMAAAENGFSANMNVAVQEVKTTRDQYIADSEKQFVALHGNLHSSSKVEVGGQPAVVFDWEAEMGGRSLRFLSLGVILPDRVLLVTYTAPVSSFAELEGEFRRSLASFKLTGK